MASIIVVGCCGESADERSLAYAKRMANLIGDCEVTLSFVIEWSPFTFQTPEENARRHKRRQEEIEIAEERILKPLVANMESAGVKTTSMVRHGDVAEILNAIAVEKGAEQLIVARASKIGLSGRIFGSVASKLGASASVPVTIVG